MEYSQKFIEAEASYELDENFVDAIMALPSMDRVRVIRQVNSSYESFTSDEENTQLAAGRLGGEMFYQIEYYKVEDYMIILLDFSVIDIDTYLDHMNDKTILMQ